MQTMKSQPTNDSEYGGDSAVGKPRESHTDRKRLSGNQTKARPIRMNGRASSLAGHIAARMSATIVARILP
jgi:hypothetical protein